MLARLPAGGGKALTRRRRHRCRTRRPDGGRSAGAGRRPCHRLRRYGVRRPQIPDGRPRRAQSDPQRAVAGNSWRAIAKRRRSCNARSRRFRRTPCAPGARRWGSRPSSAPAAACFRKRSRPRRCCAHGCAGSMPTACSSRSVIAGLGWDEDGRLLFQTPDGRRAIEARATVLALGGASWPRLGSDGAWVDILAAKGVAISPLRPANCGFTVAWSDIFRDRFEGQPLKGVALTFGPHTVRGEADRHPHRHRRRRDLCAVGGIARGRAARGAGNAEDCIASRSRNR